MEHYIVRYFVVPDGHIDQSLDAETEDDALEAAERNLDRSCFRVKDRLGKQFLICSAHVRYCQVVNQSAQEGSSMRLATAHH